MTPDAPTTRVGGAVAGAAVASSVWISAGALAVVNATSLARVATLPDAGWLAAGLAAGAGVGALLRPPRSTLAPLALLALLWLPWLPLRVPPVFLMWEGPLEGLLWASVLVGVAWRAVGSRAAALTAVWWTPPRAPITAGVLAAVIFAGAWVMVRPRVPAGDEPHYLVITQSLLRDGDLRIENNHQQDHYLEYYDAALRPDFMQRGLDGQIYSIHAPGVSALVLPAFAVAGYPGAVAAVIVVAAAGVSAAWLAAFWLTASIGAAWAAWLALAVSAPVVLHGYTIYPDAVGAAAAMTGVLGLVALEGRPGTALSRAGWSAIGGALALLPWLHTRFALVAGVLGVAILLRLRRRPGSGHAITAFVVPPVVASAAWFAYFWRIYGTPNPAAPYGARPEGGLGFIPAGVVGLLSDQQFGLMATAPVLLAAVLGVVPLARRRPRLALELLAVLALYIGAVSTYPMWWGGYSAPGRFAVVVLPMLALPLAAWWRDGSPGRRVIGVLTVVSAAITATLLLHDRGAFIFNGRDGHALLLDWLSPAVDLTLGTPSVHRDGAIVAAGDAVIWLLAGVVAAGASALLARWRAGGALATVAGVVAAPIAAMAALPVVWAGRDRPAVTPPTSQMAFLDRWQPSWRPLGVEILPPTKLALEDLIGRLSLSTSLRGHRVPGVSPLLQIPLVPAGEFDVFVEGRSRLAGTAMVRLGRDDAPLETWSLDGRPAGVTGLVLRLPAIAPAIVITGDDAAQASVRRLTLRPRMLPDDEAQPHALRAARFGATVLFALDDNLFLEPGALWVRGEGTARVIVQPDDAAGAAIRLKAGAVANVVTLASADWTREVSLAPDEARDVLLPPAALSPAVLSVTSASGFRPSEHDPGNRDGRWLGVYLSWP